MLTSIRMNRLSYFFSRTILLLLLIGTILIHTNYAFFTSTQRATGRNTFAAITDSSSTSKLSFTSASVSTLNTRQEINTINSKYYYNANTFQSIIIKKACSTTTNLMMTKLMFNGKTKDFKAGSPLSSAVAQLGCKVVYSCRKGDCATCQVIMDGRMARCCIGKVPDAPKDKTIIIQS